MADSKESDALLDVLHKYSEELLDSDVDQKTNDSDVQTIDAMECQQLSPEEQRTHLGSIKDLMAFEDHLYYKSTTQLTADSFAFIDTTNNINNDINYISKPLLSPLSCDSDSGYESVLSPTFSMDDQLSNDSTNVCLDETFTELFPDLV